MLNYTENDGDPSTPLRYARDDVIKTLRTECWFYLFIAIHLIAWTIAPFLSRFTLPMDSIEGTIWGHQLEWGYDKNPFLNGWLTSLAVHLSGYSAWSIYLFSQISVIIGFIAIWQLAKKMLPPVYALLSVLLLEAVQYYNIHSIDFNDNTLELALWPLTILFFYRAVQKKNTLDWLFTGIFAALGMMAKYYTACLLLPMLFFMITEKKCHSQFKQYPLYAGLMIFVVIVSPHLVWLCSHHFVTVDYALQRVNSTFTWEDHIHFPLQFGWQQIETFLPSVGLTCFLLLGKKPWRHTSDILPSSFDKRFLWYLGMGPFFLTLFLAIITGIRLRAGWGQPLLSLWSILLLAYLKPVITPARFYRFITLFYALFILMIILYCAALIKADEPSSANYPGKEIATAIQQQWHERYHRPLMYVAGARWIAGNIAFYATDHPTVYIDWNPETSPWIHEKILRQQGAVFLWDTTEDNQIPLDEIQKRFPRLKKPEIFYFTWHRNKKLPPIKVTAALLPPSDQ